MSPPQMDGSAMELEKSTERDAARYFGRMSEDTPPTLSQLHQQALVDDLLEEIVAASKQTLALCRQYMAPEEVDRIAGPGASEVFLAAGSEIRGEYDLLMEFDVRDLDLEFLKEKLTVLNTFILPMDTMGLVDRARIVNIAMGWLDPRLAEESVLYPQASSESEIEAEKGAYSLIATGTEPPMIEGGQNHGLRLQVLQQILQNPEVQQMAQARPVMAEMIERRMKHHQHQVQQQQNAITGRLGATPVEQEMAQQQQMPAL
jgi:hypothetical protein